MQEHYHGRYYAKAQNLARSLTAAYDAALQECDLLAMPTVPLKATRIPAPDASREELVARSMEMAPNTAPFDVSGHPATQRSVRHVGRPAGRHDADRPDGRRRDRAAGCGCVSAPGVYAAQPAACER